jgi:hypothetical protein
LTTGEPRDVYAAAFDKKTHLALVLAKNGPIMSDDIDTLVTLLPSMTSAEESYPFLFIEKRINNVRNTIEAFLDDMVGSVPASILGRTAGLPQYSKSPV